MSSANTEQTGRFFEDVKAHGQAQIIEALGCDEDLAAQVAHGIADRLAKAWGGSMLYVAKQHKLGICDRDWQIYQAFNGRNHHELAKRFGLSLPYIYKILANFKKQNQPNLF